MNGNHTELKSRKIKAHFKVFSLPKDLQMDSVAIVPTVKGTWLLKYGIHAYYVYDFKALKGYCISIKHMDIVLPGLLSFFKANSRRLSLLSIIKSVLQRFHFQFNFLEEIMLMTVPHTATNINEGRFFINLWSYFGYLDVDLKKHSVRYVMMNNNTDSHVFGSQQYFNQQSNELYTITYSLPDSLKRIQTIDQKTAYRLVKQNTVNGELTEVSSGEFVDYLHDIVINETGQYCAICELGLYTDKEDRIVPSKVLIQDFKNGKSWEIEKFKVAAHAQFDPENPDVIYFSNHNFTFVHTSFMKLLTQATYGINFRGPASLYQYRLTADGPVETAVYTGPEFYRLTNFHVFLSQGKKIIAATSSPNFIHILDAERMSLIKIIEISHAKKDSKCLVGTISPSMDGLKLFVHTNRSFQIIDIASGTAVWSLHHKYNHTCANHMLTIPGFNTEKV